MPSKELWIFAETTEHQIAPVVYEILSETRNLAKQIKGTTCALLIGANVREHVSSLRDYGAKKVYLLDQEVFSQYSLDTYVSALKILIERNRPLVLLFGATAHGAELAARIAARIKVPCITEAKSISLQNQQLAIAKSCYEDRLYQNFRFDFSRLIIITVPPGHMDSQKSQSSEETIVVHEPMPKITAESRTRLIGSFKADPKEIQIEEADVIVAGGRGAGRNLAILEALAETLGASIGGTRPLVDEGIIGFDRQIGITGKSVSPRFLLACGISGAREFMAGIEKAHLTIAINTDSRAPIFEKVDLGVYGNANEIVPVLVDKLRQKKTTKR